MENKKLEYYHQPHKKKFSLKTFGILVFILIVLLLILTAFADKNINMTGNAVVEGEEEGLKIQAELSIAPLDLDSVFEKVVIKGSDDSYLVVGREKFDLSKSSNTVRISNFRGEILTHEKNLVLLKGKAQKISVNGVPILSDSSSLSIRLEEFTFRELEINNGVYIKSLSYSTSGSVKIEEQKVILNLDQETINLEKFYGSLKIKGSTMELEGGVAELSVEGDSSLHIS